MPVHAKQQDRSDAKVLIKIFVLTSINTTQVHFPVTLVNLLIMLYNMHIEIWIQVKFLSKIWQKPACPRPCELISPFPKVRRQTHWLRPRTSVNKEAPFVFCSTLALGFSLSKSPGLMTSDHWSRLESCWHLLRTYFIAPAQRIF